MKKAVVKKTLAVLMAGALLLIGGCTTGSKTGKGGKTSFIIGTPGGDSLTPMELVNNFKAANADKYDIMVDEGSWGDFTQKVKLQMAAKNEVTTVFITDSLQAPSWGAQGALEDLKSRVDADIDASKFTGALFAVTDTEGHLWGVPHAINPIAIAYNKDIFDEKGIEYPSEDWTWQEMLDKAKALTYDRDGDGTTDVYGIAYATNITQGYLPFMAAVGANPYKDDFRNSNLDDPKILEAFQKYQEAYLEGYAPSPAVVSPYGSNDMMFAMGDLAMYITTGSAMTRINNNAGDMEWDVQMMPIGWNGERSCIYVPNVWVMYSGASDAQKEGAWEWLQYYLSDESQMKVAEEGKGGFPVMKAALDKMAEADTKPENKAAFYKGIDAHGMTILENPCSNEVNTIIQTYVHKIRENEAPIEELLASAHQEAQEELDFYYEGLE